MSEKISTDIKKVIAAGVAGNAVEWYDFGLFAFFAPVFAKLFFPTYDPLCGLLSTFAVFGVGYLMRPVGGILFGIMGDRLGRKVALLSSIILMAIPTFLIGCLPTYQTVGVLAPILLLLLRLLQGVSVGGEYAGSISFLGEHAPPNRRAFVTSWTFVGGKLGLLIGSGVAGWIMAQMGEGPFLAWGWRIPFWLGLVAAGIGFYLRLILTETPAYLEAKSAETLEKNPLKSSLTTQRRQLFIMICLLIPQTISVYTFTVYLPTHLSSLREFTHANTLIINMVSLMIFGCFIPLCGWLSDRCGRKPMMYLCYGGLILLTYPGLVLMGTLSLIQILFLQIIFAFVIASGQTAAAGILIELFPTRIRYTSISLAFNLAISIFGGMTPFMATYLVSVTGSFNAPALLVVSSAFLGIAALRYLPESYRQELRA